MNFLDLYRWTHANKRAANDYYQRPTRACRKTTCDNLAERKLCDTRQRGRQGARPDQAGCGMNAEGISPASEQEGCQADGWTYEATEVTCDLPAGHGGKHVDKWAGWEWRDGRGKRLSQRGDSGGAA